MIEVRESSTDELAQICNMEQDANVAEYILPYTLQEHIDEFHRREVLYLSIYQLRELVGFFILALDPDQNSIELRRVVVAKRGLGIGQRAFPVMETYCLKRLKRKRLWLDVFEFNQRGRHLYSKLGYTLFDQRDHGKNVLLYFQKTLD